jgi:RNA polymerase sigma-70 factor, ECF subfamily
MFYSQKMPLSDTVARYGRDISTRDTSNMIVLVLPDDSSDERLLELARQGNKSAVSEIYNRYIESIYQFVRLRIGDVQAAEDISSTVFEKLILGLAEGKGPKTHLRGWLFQVARHAIYDTYGKKQALPLETIEQWSAPTSEEPEQQLLANMDVEALRDMLQMLSPDQQEILLLRFDQQLGLKETADILGKGVGTVKTLQFRAVKRLRQLLQRLGMENENYE